MELKLIDPRSLKDNPDKARRSKPGPQADALLLATIRAVGIVGPPIVKSPPQRYEQILHHASSIQTQCGAPVDGHNWLPRGLSLSQSDRARTFRMLCARAPSSMLGPGDIGDSSDMSNSLGWIDALNDTGGEAQCRRQLLLHDIL